MVKFRFEDLAIWQLAIQIANDLFDIADDLEKKHLYRFAEQLRSAGLSMPNNIAEGSGSNSKKEFIRYLYIARCSTFENANIIIILHMRKIVADNDKGIIIEKLDVLSRKITNFIKSISIK
jgi:four helix bundle protein